MKSDSKVSLKEINDALKEARDDLHDAKIGGDAELVSLVEKRIQELRQKKSELLKESNVR